MLTSYASRSYRYWGEIKGENWPLDPCGDETKQAVEGRARSLYPPPGTSICSSNQNYVCTKNSYFDIVCFFVLFCNDLIRFFEVSKGLAVLRDVVRLVPGHLGARLLMARAFYSTGQADLAHQALQVGRCFV